MTIQYQIDIQKYIMSVLNLLCCCFNARLTFIYVYMCMCVCMSVCVCVYVCVLFNRYKLRLDYNALYETKINTL